jgi:thiol-disulfide isomerase/thioredoxin
MGCLVIAPGIAQDKGEITLTVVKYDGLKDAVVKEHGKVVLVDFWGLGCIPCMQAFPHLVELHHKYAKQGLVVITVALDDIHSKDTPDIQKKIVAFLNKSKAVFRNLVLDEPVEFWQEKLRFNVIPNQYLFDRQGKWAQFDGNIDHEAVEKQIVKLLQEK